MDDSYEYPQHIFLWRTVENYLIIIPKYSPYLFHWVCNDVGCIEFCMSSETSIEGGMN